MPSTAKTMPKTNMVFFGFFLPKKIMAIPMAARARATTLEEPIAPRRAWLATVREP